MYSNAVKGPQVDYLKGVLAPYILQNIITQNQQHLIEYNSNIVSTIQQSKYIYKRLKDIHIDRLPDPSVDWMLLSPREIHDMKGGEQLLINEMSAVYHELLAIHNTFARMLTKVNAKQLSIRSKEVDDAMQLYTNYIHIKYKDTTQLCSDYLNYLKEQGRVESITMKSCDIYRIYAYNLLSCLIDKTDLLRLIDKLVHATGDTSTDKHHNNVAVIDILTVRSELIGWLHMIYHVCYDADALIGRINSSFTGIGTHTHDFSVELDAVYTRLTRLSEDCLLFTSKYNKLVSDCKQINLSHYGYIDNIAELFAEYNKNVIVLGQMHYCLHKVREAYRPPPQSLPLSSPPPPHESSMAQPQALPQVSTGTMTEAVHSTTTATTTASATASVDADINAQYPTPVHTNTDSELAKDCLSLTAHYPPGSVIASITVEFAADVTVQTTPETSTYSTTGTDAPAPQPIQSSVETKRLLAELTFTGCISGHTPLDWQVTGLDYKWGTQHKRAQSALSNE